MNVVLALTLALTTIPGATPRVASAGAAEIETLTLDGKAGEATDKGRSAVRTHPDDVDLRLALARAIAATARHVKRVVEVPMTQADVDRGQVTVPGLDLEHAPKKVDYDKDLLDEALGHLEAAIQRARRRQDVRVFQCFLLTDSGRIDRAKTAISDALTALPKTPELASTMAAYGAERAKRGDPAGGVVLLAPVVAAFPKEGPVLADYGNLLTRLNRKTEAFSAFDRATAAAPNDVRIVRTKAVSAVLLRDFRRARGAYETAFRLEGGATDALAASAAAYGVDPKSSAGPMRKLASEDMSSDPSLRGLASQFVRAATTGPASKDAMALARTLMTSQQYVLAIPVLDRAAHAAPGNTEARSLLKNAYGQLGCPALAP